MNLRRPTAIHDVARAAEKQLGGFHDLLKDFVLEFSHMSNHERAAALAVEPRLLNGDGVADAYLAATAELLALRENLDRPDWTSGAQRFLRRAWYAGGLESLKPVLLAESPAAFRIRNLFVSANALDRPGYTISLNEVRGSAPSHQDV